MKKINRDTFTQLFHETIDGLEGKDYALDNFGRYFDTCNLIARFISQNSRFLDVGIYPGQLALLIKKLFNPVMTGISTTITDHFLSIMKKNNIEILTTDIEKEKLLFEDKTFDIILAAELIEHVYNPYNLFKESYRVLAPGGYYIITSPNLSRLKNRLQFFFSGKPVMEHLHGNIEVFETNDWTHKREYTWHEVFMMMESVGFITEVKEFTSLFHYPSSSRIKAKNLIKDCIYLSPNWKGGLLCVGKKPLR